MIADELPESQIAKIRPHLSSGGENREGTQAVKLKFRKVMRALEVLLFRLKTTEGQLVCHELALVAIHRIQLHASGSDVELPSVLDCEVVDASSIGCEVCRSGFVTLSQNNSTLPARAEMMNSGIDGNVEERIAVIGPHPLAIDADTGGGLGMRGEF
jgi:hypothetical protein